VTYQALDSKSAVEYVKNCPALANVLPNPENLVAKEVGDGNLNLVFIIENSDDPKQSVVLKQALPYLPCRRRLLAPYSGADAI
jgi:5-methylthioribose kinase